MSKQKIVYDELTDEQLVQAIVRGKDALLFGELYDRYSKMVYNKCYGFAKSAGEAEDLTQDVFLLVFIKLASFKGKSKFSSWLYSFTYNFCVNYVNRNKERKLSDKTEALSGREQELVLDVKDELIYTMRVERLKKALDTLHPEDRKILLLKYQDGVPIKELQPLLEKSESAIKMKIKRAKARLVAAYNK